MLDEPNHLELSAEDLKMIENALHTQEKILSVQSRAGGNAAKTRLTELRNLIYRVRRQNPVHAGETKKTGAWCMITRGLFC